VPLISTLFQHGRFTAADVLQTQQALIAYSIGLVGLILVKVLARASTPSRYIRTPVKIALVTLLLTQLMNLAFIVPLKHAGLALSIGLASLVNAALLYRGLRLRRTYVPLPGWRRFLARLAVALVALGAVLWFCMGTQDWWLGASLQARAARLALLVAGGAGAYFATLYALGFRPADFRRPRHVIPFLREEQP